MLSYLKRLVHALLHQHAAPTHIPRERQDTNPVWVSEGSDRLPVHVGKLSPSVLASLSHTHVENNRQEQLRQTVLDIVLGWTWPGYDAPTVHSQRQSQNLIVWTSSQAED